MFVHTADRPLSATDSAPFGLSAILRHVDWPAIRDRIFGRIDPISAGGEEYRREHQDNANLTLLRGTATFTGPKTLQVTMNDGTRRTITSDTIVLGAGSRPELPAVDGRSEEHTSELQSRGHLVCRLPLEK